MLMVRDLCTSQRYLVYIIKMEVRFNHKLFLVILKIIPMVLAFVYFIVFILSIFNIRLMWLSLLSHTSILPLIFFYVSSYAFNFCEYHRMFLHYITFMSVVNIVDKIAIIPIEPITKLVVIMIITFIFLIITLYKYLKSKRHVDKNI